MTGSIQSSQSPYPTPPSQSPQETQKLFEIEFETGVLSIFVSVTGQNGSVKNQLSQLKNGIQAGMPTGPLATELNQLISQINTTIIPGKAPFPPFQFTSEGSQVQGITSHALTLQKCLNTLAENQQLPWPAESQLFGQLSNLITTVGQITPQQAFTALNQIIEAANGDLPLQYQIPPVSST